MLTARPPQGLSYNNCLIDNLSLLRSFDHLFAMNRKRRQTPLHKPTVRHIKCNSQKQVHLVTLCPITGTPRHFIAKNGYFLAPSVKYTVKESSVKSKSRSTRLLRYALGKLHNFCCILLYAFGKKRHLPQLLHYCTSYTGIIHAFTARSATGTYAGRDRQTIYNRVRLSSNEEPK